MLERLVCFIRDNKTMLYNTFSHYGNAFNTIVNINEGSCKHLISQFPKPRKKRYYKGNSDIYRYVSIDAHFNRFAHYKPGYFEVDLVEHKDSNSSGLYAVTLNFVDVYSQFISRYSALGKDYQAIKVMMEKITEKIPFPILSLHPDNEKGLLKMAYDRAKKLIVSALKVTFYYDFGFWATALSGIGLHIACRTDMLASPSLPPHKIQNLTTKALLKQKLNIEYSRSRPYKKNDNSHIEQKNGDKVRKLVGYYRYDTEFEVSIINQIYELSDLIDNYFIPSFKLKSKIIDAKGRVIRREFLKPKTPYQRIIECKEIDEKIKIKMKDIYKSLNYIELKEKRDKLIEKLIGFKTGKKVKIMEQEYELCA